MARSYHSPDSAGLLPEDDNSMTTELAVSRRGTSVCNVRSLDSSATWSVPPAPLTRTPPWGSRTVKIVPRPGRLCTVMEPPCASAIHFVIASPRPVPGRSPVRERAGSARQNRSKMCGRSPGAMPIPCPAR